jgi:nucleoside-diphosphate-sugar epimerase
MSSPRTVAVVGGHGHIARLLHPLLLEAGHTPVALVRKQEQADRLEAEGVSTRHLDIEADDVDAFAEALEGCDAVVFAAGGGADGNIERKRTVDLEGSTKSVDAAKRVGVRRFVQVSAIGVDEPLPEDTDDVWRAYVEAKRDADAYLRDSGLDWTIIRPGRLTDDAPTGQVALGEDVSRGDVTRGDVAAVLAAVLEDDRAAGHQWNLVGGETPLAEAVAKAVGRD